MTKDSLAHRPPPPATAALREARALLENARRTRDVRMIEQAIELLNFVLSEPEPEPERTTR